MGAYLTEAKNRAVTMEGELRKNFPYLEMKVAFVGYRDITDSNRFEIMEFTDNSQDLQRFITGISPTGGGDTPEDILGGLKKVLDLSWRRPTRLLLHVADAPCHGKQYHDCDDSYPGGDPTGLTPDHLLPLLATQKIEYFFFKINSSTDKMVIIFISISLIKVFNYYHCSDVHLRKNIQRCFKGSDEPGNTCHGRREKHDELHY
jgi:hypothetical protein